MSVSGITSGYLMGYRAKRTTRAISEKGFDNTTIKGADDLIAKKRVGITQQASVMDIYNSMGRFAGSISKVEETKSISLQSKTTGDIVENDRYIISLSNDISECYRIHDKQLNKYYTIDPARTSLQTDVNTGKDYLIQSDNWGGLTDAIQMTSSLHSALKEFMGVEEISSGQLNDKYVVYKDKFSGIETMTVKGNEGSVSVMMIGGKDDEKQIQELADIYREKYPNLVPSDESARALAMLEVIGHTVRTEKGIMMVTSNGINYMDENDTSKSWAIIYSMNGTDVYKEIIKAIQENAVEGGIENVSGWEDWFKGNGYDYERVLSDEELEQAANQESETKTDIIVKPDGSRVLVVTMNIGGMETTMSLEISKPTEAPNENSKQDTENNMPSADAETNTVSDEMSNISTET
ncbi:MAG: hypothetical protein NC429_17555 [Lachnospiraceae bacterium]|nr:hypothetical protein [Lachnospiraceae bacterium]